MPLSALEFKLWYDLVSATKGHGFLQILPVGYRSSHAFKSNLLQIIPKKTKDWGNFESPLDKMIAIREEFYKNENKRLFDENQKMDKKKPSVSEEVIKEEESKNEHIYKFSKQNIFKLPEFDFPHCVCILDSKPTDNSLVTDYIKISDELDLKNLNNLGITIIMNDKYMFVSLLSQPYITMEDDLHLFIDPFAYAGIANIHIKQYSWPQTAGIDVKGRQIGSGQDLEILSYLPSKLYSEPLPSQLPELELAVEENGEIEEAEGEGDGRDEEAEGEGEKET